jgi:small subunit ribosomal protein S5
MLRNLKSEQNEQTEWKESTVSIRRVVKVVKGGRRLTLSVLVIVGDGKGRVGYGMGKGKEFADAHKKAVQKAKKSLIKVSLRENRTIHHDVVGNFGAGKVIIRSAKSGTGIIAGSAMRAIFEKIGMQDIVSKCIGSSNEYNMVMATFDALTNLSSPKLIAERRNLKVGEIIERREIGEKNT